MKVLLLTTHLNIGGVAVYTLNLAKGLKRNSVQVYVASSGGQLAKGLRENKIVHITIPVKTKFEFHPKLVIAFFRLLSFIKRNDIDVIHAQTRVTQVLAYFLSAASNAAYVSTCHGFFKKTRMIRKIFAAWGHHVIAISGAVQDHLIKDLGVRKESVFLIYNGIDAEEFAADSKKENGALLKDNLGFAKCPVVGTISRLSPVKGLRYLLFAVKDLVKDIPEMQFLIVGDGPLKDFLKGLVKKLGIESNVFFASSTTQTRNFLSIMDIFVFYSLEEGLGLSLLEALAAGKPCVASNVGGVSSVIKNGRTGLLVPPRDTHALKEAIIKLLRDKNLSAFLAKNGKELVKSKFSLNTMVQEVTNVYKKACKKEKI